MFTAQDLLRLSQLLRDYRAPLRADFLREYGLDLDHIIEQRVMTPSRLLDLIDWLPLDAAIWRAIRPPEPDDVWTLDAQLTATAVDILGGILAIQRARFEGKRRVSFPDPIARPGVGPKDGAENLAGDTFDSTEAWDEWYASQAGGRRAIPSTARPS